MERAGLVRANPSTRNTRTRRPLSFMKWPCAVAPLSLPSARLLFKKQLIQVPRDAIVIERRATDVAQIGTGGGESPQGGCVDHRHLLGQDGLNLVEIFLPLRLIEGLDLGVHQEIDAGL